MKSLLTFSEVVDVLRLSARTLEKLVGSGDIPVIRIGRRRMFDPDDIETFINNRKEWGN